MRLLLRAWSASALVLWPLDAMGAAAASAEEIGVTEPELIPDLGTRSGYEDVPQVGGPTGPGARLTQADLEKDPTIVIPGWSDRLGDRWFAWKEIQFQARGIAFGLSYNVLGQTYDGEAHSKAAGGLFDAVVSWTLLGRDTQRSGTLVLLVENQHSYGSMAPEPAGVLAGSALPTASFADSGWHINNIYWRQQLAGDRALLVAGIVDTTDYVDYHALNDPLLSFSSFAFSGTPTMPLPDPGAGVMLRLASDGYYLSAGIADGSAIAGDADYGHFLEEAALFSHVELGATPSFGERFVENVHFTLWHQAAGHAADISDDWGGAMTISTRHRDRVVAFFRAALARGRTTLTDRALSFGAAYNLRSFDMIGMAASWANATAGDGDQYTLEGFYRFQFGPLATLTPHMQVIVNPALTPDASTLVVAGLRLRVAL